MKPEKKMTATMNTTPATMPTQAATRGALDRRGSSRTTGSAGGGVTTGPVAGSGDADVSLMGTIMHTVVMCPSCITYESAVRGKGSARHRGGYVAGRSVVVVLASVGGQDGHVENRELRVLRRLRCGGHLGQHRRAAAAGEGATNVVSTRGRRGDDDRTVAAGDDLSVDVDVLTIVDGDGVTVGVRVVAPAGAGRVVVLSEGCRRSNGQDGRAPSRVAAYLKLFLDLIIGGPLGYSVRGASSLKK
jgi:hypothetical protein